MSSKIATSEEFVDAQEDSSHLKPEIGGQPSALDANKVNDACQDKENKCVFFHHLIAQLLLLLIVIIAELIGVFN